MDNRAMIQKSLDYIEENLQTKLLLQSWQNKQDFPCFTTTACFSKQPGCR